MNIRHLFAVLKILLLLVALLTSTLSHAQVTVVDMIPNALSNETNRDSEPSVAANPSNPLEIVASAFTPDPLSSGNGPIYISTDGGNTWDLNVVLPGGNRTVDISLRYGTLSDTVYAGILRYDNFNLNILRKVNIASPGLMTILINRADDDQPWVESYTRLRGAAEDRVYVSSNDLSIYPGQTSSEDQSMDAATAPAPAGFSTQRINTRSNCGQDGPCVRTAVHPDGTIYVVYFRWTACSSSPYTSDVVVARDDNWGSGATPYTDLVDTGDSQAGMRVVTGVSIPWSQLGTQRIGSQAAIAVDPRDSDIVYIAWADGTAANYTIHVRRSVNRGVTWSTDLRSVSPATNPGLAINTHGRVGFFYQQLTGTTPNQRWETHFEYSDDAFATAPTDLLLADVPDENGSYTGKNPIGDYANVIALGKNFYGVFSANNTPDPANFPNGINFLRNVDLTAHQLRNLSDTANVDVSIDPFFFSVEGISPEDDFYVRDWTDSITSGDTGLEPSTHPVFYSTSDVWNRRGTLTGEPFASDQPANEPAGNGAGNIGDNWAFARIRRNALPTSGSQTVTAHFLVSKLGTGSNYVDSSSADPDVSFTGPDPTVVFSATSLGPIITSAYHWHLNAVSSTHLCLAVEISTPDDPYVAPSVLGSAPGWPTTDLRFINDNNKAQRNMGLSTTPARGVGMVDSIYGIAHNAAPFPRDMILRYEVPKILMKRLEKASVILGDHRQRLQSVGTISLKNMQPGENRWVGLSFKAPTGKAGEVLPVYFYEIVENKPINGFALGVQLSTFSQAGKANLELHRSEFTRVAAGFRIQEAAQEVEAAFKLLKQDKILKSPYLKFLKSRISSQKNIIDQLITSQRIGDPFSIKKALDVLANAVRSGNAESAALAHTTFLNRLDAYITKQQLTAGDVADILQNVRWQELLYKTKSLPDLKCAKSLVKISHDFITSYGRRKLSNKDYPVLIRKNLKCFYETAEHPATRKLRLTTLVKAIERNLGDLRALQKSHREFLLQLQKIPEAGRK